MKPVSILLALLSLAPLHAELPSVIASMLKQQADQFAAAMKAYDTNVEAMVKRDRGNDVRLQLADKRHVACWNRGSEARKQVFVPLCGLGRA